jgi:hypothetical protein
LIEIGVIKEMYDCSFEINNQPMSALKILGQSFQAFSGLFNYVNRRASVCQADFGPIPPGTYYIFDRQSGGLLGLLRDIYNGHGDWFSLHAIDAKIDDETYCNNIKRGNFRLHPKGLIGISKGCITIESASDYQKLRAILKGATPVTVPGSTLKAYGKVLVR